MVNYLFKLNLKKITDLSKCIEKNLIQQKIILEFTEKRLM